MHQRQQECLHKLQAARSPAEAFAATSEMARQLGFAYCAFGMRAPFPLSRPKVFTIDNYSSTLQGRYLAADCIDLELGVRRGAKAGAQWESTDTHDLSSGWAQACHDAHGLGGLLTLARGKEDIEDGELAAKLQEMSWLAQATHDSMARLLMPSLIPDAAVSLTSREIEVMRWTADGKTSSEIGLIMNISDNTVNFHIKNAVFKLNASNKTAGVVKAAMLGLLN